MQNRGFLVVIFILCGSLFFLLAFFADVKLRLADVAFQTETEIRAAVDDHALLRSRPLDLALDLPRYLWNQRARLGGRLLFAL